MNAFQIFISDNDDSLTPLISNISNIFKDSLPAHSYKLYTNKLIIDFLTNYFESNVLDAYKKLRPNAYKSDLARYCIAYIFGGWYSDLTIKIQKKVNFESEDINFIGFIDRGEGFSPNTLPYGIQSSLFYTRKTNPIFKTAIDLILHNCKTENYGVSPTCPTGPAVLGRAFAIHGMTSKDILGQFIPLTPSHKNKNRSYILPDGTVFALHKDAWCQSSMPADISNFGLKGTNNYLEMYKEKDIYN